MCAGYPQRDPRRDSAADCHSKDPNLDSKLGKAAGGQAPRRQGSGKPAYSRVAQWVGSTAGESYQEDDNEYGAMAGNRNKAKDDDQMSERSAGAHAACSLMDSSIHHPPHTTALLLYNRLGEFFAFA